MLPVHLCGSVHRLLRPSTLSSLPGLPHPLQDHRSTQPSSSVEGLSHHPAFPVSPALTEGQGTGAPSCLMTSRGLHSGTFYCLVLLGWETGYTVFHHGVTERSQLAREGGTGCGPGE